MKRSMWPVLITIATLVISFILTNYLYPMWAVWLNPADKIAGLEALALSLSPLCALVAGLLAAYWLNRKNSGSVG